MRVVTLDGLGGLGAASTQDYYANQSYTENEAAAAQGGGGWTLTQAEQLEMLALQDAGAVRQSASRTNTLNTSGAIPPPEPIPRGSMRTTAARVWLYGSMVAMGVVVGIAARKAWA